MLNWGAASRIRGCTTRPCGFTCSMRGAVVGLTQARGHGEGVPSSCKISVRGMARPRVPLGAESEAAWGAWAARGSTPTLVLSPLLR